MSPSDLGTKLDIMPRNAARTHPSPTGRYATVGMTRDGVSVLKPKNGPNSFTAKELRSVTREFRTGKFVSGPAANDSGHQRKTR